MKQLFKKPSYYLISSAMQIPAHLTTHSAKS